MRLANYDKVLPLGGMRPFACLTLAHGKPPMP